MDFSFVTTNPLWWCRGCSTAWYLSTAIKTKNNTDAKSPVHMRFPPVNSVHITWAAVPCRLSTGLFKKNLQFEIFYIKYNLKAYVNLIRQYISSRFFETNLTKFAVILVKRHQKAGVLRPRGSTITLTKEKTRRKRKSKEKRKKQWVQS